MWLLDANTLALKEFSRTNVPKYAILSHTWEEDEVVCSEWPLTDASRAKAGFKKIKYTCQQAAQDGYDYVWIDTCCIDKRSSAELSEAINSMFTWYSEAAVCYVYLVDVAALDPSMSSTMPSYGTVMSAALLRKYRGLVQSRWFTRGWTLQELLAPASVRFYSRDWSYMGNKRDLYDVLQHATGIDAMVLSGEENMRAYSIAARMSWAARRQTKRVEDMAYCLLGVFGVTMPLLYGEGGVKAFARLQEQIMLESDDQSLFAWVDKEAADNVAYSLLAPHPRCFADTGHVRPWYDFVAPELPTITNGRISISLRLSALVQTNQVIATLDCGPLVERFSYVGIFLKPVPGGASRGWTEYRRVRASKLVEAEDTRRAQRVVVRQAPPIADKQHIRPQLLHLSSIRSNMRLEVKSIDVPTFLGRHETCDASIKLGFKDASDALRQLRSILPRQPSTADDLVSGQLRFIVPYQLSTVAVAFAFHQEDSARRFTISFGRHLNGDLGFHFSREAEFERNVELDLTALGEGWKTLNSHFLRISLRSVATEERDDKFYKVDMVLLDMEKGDADLQVLEETSEESATRTRSLPELSGGSHSAMMFMLGSISAVVVWPTAIILLGFAFFYFISAVANLAKHRAT